MATADSIRLFLCGDVMTGRGIDQILPHPVDPVLYENYVTDARDYVRLAEEVYGPIPRRASPAYVWGDALEELDRAGPDLRIANLETSLTTSPDWWPGKAVNYRMHPDNMACLTTARLDLCCLANNHVMDWGRRGLLDTLDALDAAGIRRAGAGRDAAEARAWTTLDAKGKGRVLVSTVGSVSSGIPQEWAAGPGVPGVNLLEAFPGGEAGLAAGVAEAKQEGGVLVASIHWGGNWGYEVPASQRRLAHALVEAGADVVHGHSSHHPKGVELYRDRLILYGCGDFINDYEGIGGNEEFRPELAVMVLADLDPASGLLLAARLVPFRMRGFSLRRARGEDSLWLAETLSEASRPFATRLALREDDALWVLPA